MVPSSGTASKIFEAFKGADKLQYVVVAKYTHINLTPYPSWIKVVGSQTVAANEYCF